MTKTSAIISYVQNHWDWKDIYLINAFTASPLCAPPACGAQPAGSSPECSPPWTWSAGGFPWPRGLTCPGATPRSLPPADRSLANDRPTSEKQRPFKKNQELLSRGVTYGKARCKQSDIAHVTQ